MNETEAGVSDQLLTTKEAAKIVGRSVRTIQRWIDEGHLNSHTSRDYRGNERRLISREQLERYAQAGASNDGTTTLTSRTVNDEARAIVEQYLMTISAQATALGDANARLDTALRDMAEARERAAAAERAVEERVIGLQLAKEAEEKRARSAESLVNRLHEDLTALQRVMVSQHQQRRRWWRLRPQRSN